MKNLLIGMGIGMIIASLIFAAISIKPADLQIPSIDEPSLLPAYLTGNMPQEKNSPADRISQNDIHMLNDKVIIDIKNPDWAMFTDTNSMDPLFDAGANAIEIVPGSELEIQAGDIVSYKSEYADGIIIHRVAATGSDENGWYAIMKGDNNPSNDPGKVRFSQIQRVVVAIIY